MAINLNELKRLAEAAKGVEYRPGVKDAYDEFREEVTPDVTLRLIEIVETTKGIMESARNNIPHNPDFHKATRLPAREVCCPCGAALALDEIAKLEQGNAE